MARTSSPNRPTPEELRNLYDEQGLTDSELAERCKVSRATVQRWRKEAGIAGRSMEEAYQVRTAKRRTRSDTKRPPKEELIDVLKTMSQRAASRKFGVSGGTVWVWCKYYGIDMAAIKPAPEPIVSAEPPPVNAPAPVTPDRRPANIASDRPTAVLRTYRTRSRQPQPPIQAAAAKRWRNADEDERRAKLERAKADWQRAMQERRLWSELDDVDELDYELEEA